MILWGIFFTFLTTISLIFCGNGCWSWHLLVGLGGWLVGFLFGHTTNVFCSLLPPRFCHHRMCVRLCVHCYFISILPLCYCDYPNGYCTSRRSYIAFHRIASHDCVYELTPVMANDTRRQQQHKHQHQHQQQHALSPCMCFVTKKSRWTMQKNVQDKWFGGNAVFGLFSRSFFPLLYYYTICEWLGYMLAASNDKIYQRQKHFDSFWVGRSQCAS